MGRGVTKASDMFSIVEKILIRASGKANLSVGEYLSCEVDLAMVHDSSGPRRIGPKLAEMQRQLFNKNRFAIVTDHFVPAHDDASRQIKRITEDFVKSENIRHYYPEEGICHVVLPQKGLLYPGMFFVGGDSHSTTAGAFGCYAFGIGATDMAGVAATGEIWIKVPQTRLVNLKGHLGKQVFAKDIILYLCGCYGMNMAEYQALEFAGDGIAALSMQERMTLSNMSAELGAQAGIIAPDDVTATWLDIYAPERTFLNNLPDAHWKSDVGSHSGPVFDINLDILSPFAAAPHSPANAAPISDHESPKFTIAYIGACTGAKLEDLRAAARILKGNQLASSTRLLIAPASLADQQAAQQEGIMTIFEDAGARFLPTACGMCAGYGVDRLAGEDICISSTARNFKDRMGDTGSQVWLASPASVAAAAITGRLTDPREMIVVS